MHHDYEGRAALLVVDVQNDFADPEGSLYVPGADGIVPLIDEEIEAAARAHAAVIYSQDWHPESTPHFEKDGGIWPVHCVQGSWGAAFHPGLRVAGDVVRKGTGGEDGYSAFTVREPATGETTPTSLLQMLRERGVDRLVVCGLATDYCVVETVRDARRLGYPVEVLPDAIRPVEREAGDGDRAIRRMREAGATIA